VGIAIQMAIYVSSEGNGDPEDLVASFIRLGLHSGCGLSPSLCALSGNAFQSLSYPSPRSGYWSPPCF